MRTISAWKFSGESSTPASICILAPAAEVVPPAKRMEPPMSSFFSIRYTLAPLLAASRAAFMPEKPAPMTMTSGFSKVGLAGSLASSSTSTGSRVTPACASASAAAVSTAVLVTVALATVSTSTLLRATMASGNSSRALEPMPSVSSGPSAFTAVSLPSSMVSVTVTSPPKPLAVAV